MTPKGIAITLVLALGAAGASAQSADTKFKLLVDGLYGFSIDYSESRSFEEFAESGSVDVDYTNDAGPGFGGALQYSFTPRFGVRAGASYVKRDGSASFTASMPHPLYFDQPREASGELTGLSYKETSVHLDLVVGGRSGPLDFSLFAGGSLIKVEADLASSLDKTEVYPYDEVDASLRTTSASDSPFGFNVGAGLDYRFSDRFAFGAQFFYSAAKAKLPAADGATLEVDAGGAHVTAGLRFMF
jgi:opacity protein-like surface antigen